MPARAPRSAARGVTLRIQRPSTPPSITTMLCRKTQATPACQAFIGSPVISLTGTITAKTTMKMWPTPGPDGRAHTSVRPVVRASRRASQP